MYADHLTVRRGCCKACDQIGRNVISLHGRCHFGSVQVIDSEVNFCDCFQFINACLYNLACNHIVHAFLYHNLYRILRSSRSRFRNVSSHSGLSSSLLISIRSVHRRKVPPASSLAFHPCQNYIFLVYLIYSPRASKMHKKSPVCIHRQDLEISYET